MECGGRTVRGSPEENYHGREKKLQGLGGSERKRKEMSARTLPLSFEPTCLTRATEYDFKFDLFK